MEIINHFSGFTVLLLLGLRHGLDPDHIAIIDGYTFRLHERKSSWTSWVGTLFAFGHGLMVTLIALTLSIIKNKIVLPTTAEFLIEWIPAAMLLYVGIMNLIGLGANKNLNTKSIRRWMLPKYFNNHLNPFLVILTGIIFGFIFDTSTQIAAFGFAISTTDQWAFAVIGGVVFSIGLMVTGTFDSLYLSKLLNKFDQKKIRNHRFRLNLLITLMCIIIPFYKLLSSLNPKLELSDGQNNFAGMLFIFAVACIYLDLYRKYLKQQKM